MPPVRLWRRFTVCWRRLLRSWRQMWPTEGLFLLAALLGGLEQLIEEETGINTVVAEEPTLAVAIGTGEYMELMSKMDKTL